MPKLKYSWPFVFAIVGNLFIWEEMRWQKIHRFFESINLFSSPDGYFIFFGGLTAFSMFGITVYQLWINRFPKDQKWKMVIWGGIFLVGVILVISEFFGIPSPGSLLIGFGAWCLPISIFYILRQRNKPKYLKSKFTLPKNIIVMSVLGVGVMLALIELMPVPKFRFYTGGESYLLLAYLLFLQLTMPVSLLLNLLDHHAREKGRGYAKEEEMLIEELGQ